MTSFYTYNIEVNWIVLKSPSEKESLKVVLFYWGRKQSRSACIVSGYSDKRKRFPFVNGLFYHE